jgi:protein gp37
MGTTTNIEWTGHTWNPWYGCQKVSAGCDHCYMMDQWAARAGIDGTLIIRAKTTWTKPFSKAWQKPNYVFTCSLSDFFIKEADPWRPEAWDIIRRTPHLTYQILTKRPSRIRAHLPPDWGDGWPHVWLGVSVESPQVLSRIAVLQRVPAVLRFLSLEPLLGPLPTLPLHGIGWVIVGGESGAQARPMQEVWVRDIQAQCQATSVPLFVKQMGSVWAKSHGTTGKGAQMDDLPHDLRCREFPEVHHV